MTTRMRSCAIVVAGLSGLLWASPGSAACSIERARYVMAHDAQFTAGFLPIKKYDSWPSDLALFVHSKASKQTYWFLFDAGSARYVALISTTDVLAKDWRPPEPDGGPRPLGDTHIMFADHDYRFTIAAPQRQWSRPEYLLLPDLPDVLAFSAEPHEDAPLDFFKFDHCAGPGDHPD